MGHCHGLLLYNLIKYFLGKDLGKGVGRKVMAFAVFFMHPWHIIHSNSGPTESTSSTVEVEEGEGLTLCIGGGGLLRLVYNMFKVFDSLNFLPMQTL